jgi:ABC-type transport system involved in multi-copper enzyme maturation permease subunit
MTTSDKVNVNDRRFEASASAMPMWRVVLKSELTELWSGGRALNLLIMFSLLVSVTGYLLATNNELKLSPLRQLMFVMLQTNITFGLFIGLIIGAESISGERERATLEAILLTPISRRQIIMGKFLAAISPWPAAYIFSIPYMIALAQGDAILGQALFWGAIAGTLLATAFTGFGILISMYSSSNRTSLFVSLLFYFISLFATQLPGQTQAGSIGAFLQVANPIEASRQFLLRTLMNGKPFAEVGHFLIAPIVLVIIILTLLYVLANSGLRIEGASRTR